MNVRLRRVDVLTNVKMPNLASPVSAPWVTHSTRARTSTGFVTQLTHWTSTAHACVSIRLLLYLCDSLLNTECVYYNIVIEISHNW